MSAVSFPVVQGQLFWSFLSCSAPSLPPQRKAQFQISVHCPSTFLFNKNVLGIYDNSSKDRSKEVEISL
jgi:hypothetical protein